MALAAVGVPVAAGITVPATGEGVSEMAGEGEIGVSVGRTGVSVEPPGGGVSGGGSRVLVGSPGRSDGVIEG